MRKLIVAISLAITVAVPSFATTRTWTGATSAVWSVPTNWSPQGVPSSGEALLFPSGSPTTMTNDLPAGTIVGAMTFDTAYILNGNPLTLIGDLYTNNVLNCNVDLKLGNSLQLAPATYNGTIDVNGQTLTIAGNLNGAVNGTGAIVTTGGLAVKNGGTFSGTFSAHVVDVQGAMPGANVTTTRLSGNGTVGTVSGGSIFPGVAGVGFGDPHSIDYLHTKTLTASGLSIDLNPGGISDKVLVTGTVTLAGQLQLTLVNNSPAAGQTFTIVDNDGTDSVNGNFDGLPEGATVALGFYQFHISYAGGDGNDVVLTALSTGIKTWNGTFSGLWSDARNWSPQGVPSSGEALLFPTGPPTTMTNDLPAGTSVGAMTFLTAYILNGNPLTLMGDISTNNVLNCNVDLKLGSSVHLPNATYYGAIDVNGQTLTIAGNLNGAVNGSGAIHGGSLQVRNGGTFSGTLNASAVDVQGVMAGADITTPQLSGNGTVGIVSGGSIFPGVRDPVAYPDPHSIDYLHTKTLTASGLGIDLNADGISDKVFVTGTVMLAGQLQVTVVNGSPVAGQTFTVIDNDGTDPVSGNFDGLPEGATVASGVYQFRISYAGGDGNDVVLTTLAGIKAWTGAISSNWSNPQNWSPHGVPSATEPLLFPIGPPTTVTNDMPAGTSVGPMTFITAYRLNGNPLTLMGDVSTNNAFTCNVDLKIGSSLQLPYAIYNGAIDVNGQTLTIAGNLNGAVNGSGAINAGSLTIKNGGTFSGTLNALSIDVQGVMPGANITTPELSGNGTVGTVSARIFPGVGGHGIDYLHTKTLTARGLDIDLNPAGISDKVLVTGTVTLAGELQVGVVNASPAVGQTFTIIDNDGTDPVNGNFDGVPERATVASGLYHFRISYAGGDGNDVVLTTLIDTSAALSQSAASTAFGEPFTLTTTVSAQSGTVTGSVMFTSDGVTINTVPVQNGMATLTSTALSAGTHSIVATFFGTGAFADSVSGVISHVVTRGQTQTQIAADHPNTFYGQTVRFTVTVSVQSPASGQPGGNVTILADGNGIGTVPVVNGVATFETALFHAGVKSITATYSGDANFDTSAASAIQQNVAKARTEVDARLRSPILTGESPIATVFVNGTPNLSVIPAGSVTLSEHDADLVTELLVDGKAALRFRPLSSGDHTLVVRYGGDADFEPSSATVIQTVVAPSISVHDARVTEGDHGVTTVSVVLTLSSAVATPVRVSFSTLPGTAKEGEDYEKASGVIEFAPGQVTRSVELHILGDTLPEADESLSLLLSDPVNATIDTPSAVIVITNDDQVPPRRRAARH